MLAVPTSIAELVNVLELERLDEDLFRGSHASSSEMTRVFGGQVAAQALMAAYASVPVARRVHSLHAYFVLGGDPSIPIIYDVDRIRDGGSFSTRRVSARQHGDVIFYMTARSEEHTSELQSRGQLVCRLLREKKQDVQNVQ